MLFRLDFIWGRFAKGGRFLGVLVEYFIFDLVIVNFLLLFFFVNVIL